MNHHLPKFHTPSSLSGAPIDYANFGIHCILSNGSYLENFDAFKILLLTWLDGFHFSIELRRKKKIQTPRTRKIFIIPG